MIKLIELKKLTIALLLILFSFNPVFAQDSGVRFGNQDQTFEGTTVAVTAVPLDFTYKSYAIFIRNKGATNEMYVKFGNTDITEAMIASAAARQTNKIWTIEENETLTVNFNIKAMSIMTATGETTDYFIGVLTSARIP